MSRALALRKRWLIDSSSLDQGEDSWGYAFGAFFLALYAAPVLAVVLGARSTVRQRASAAAS